MIDRIEKLERSVRSNSAAPTFPIYDPANPPQDAIDAQIFIGTDDSINWFDGTNWNTSAPSNVIVDAAPQDVIEGQIAVGSDCSLCWFSNGSWHGAPATLATVTATPQDVLECQLIVGSNCIAWYCDGQWYGLVSS